MKYEFYRLNHSRRIYSKKAFHSFHTDYETSVVYSKDVFMLLESEFRINDTDLSCFEILTKDGKIWYLYVNTTYGMNILNKIEEE